MEGYAIIRAMLITGAVSATGLSTTYEVGPGKSYSQLTAVADLLNPGDTVLVEGNQTYAGGITFERAGSAAAPVVIKGIRVNGKRPVISGGANSVAFVSQWPYTEGADHYILEGFEITGAGFRGIFHQADDLTVRDVLVHDCEAHGILGADQGAGSCLLEFVEVYHCGSGDSQHQIYMATDQVNHPGSVFRMQFCYLHDGNGGNNVKSRAERNEIYYNWIEGAYYHELELIGPDPGGVAAGWTAEMAREDSDVVGNVLRKRATAANNSPDFSVTRIGGDNTGESSGRYRFLNNTILCGSGAVFRCFDGLQSLEAHNNVFYRESGGTPNIMRVVDATWTEGSAIIGGANNWVQSGASNVPAEWIGTVLGNNPSFENIAIGNFRPSETSPLRNAGTPTTTSPSGYEFPNPLVRAAFEPPSEALSDAAIVRPDDGTCDIGAFEHGTPAEVENRHLAGIAGAMSAKGHVQWYDLRGRQLRSAIPSNSHMVVIEQARSADGSTFCKTTFSAPGLLRESAQR